MVAVIFLIGFALEDILHREIRLSGAALFALAGLLFALLVRKDPLPAVLLSLLPGLFLAACSAASRGAVGPGDAIVLGILGLLFPVGKVIAFLLAGLLLSALYAIFLLIVRRKGRTVAYPFLPFLLGGVLIVFFCS